MLPTAAKLALMAARQVASGAHVSQLLLTLQQHWWPVAHCSQSGGGDVVLRCGFALLLPVGQS
jgi:hypothetical protein